MQRGNSALVKYPAADDTLQIWCIVFLGANSDALNSYCDSDQPRSGTLLLHIHVPAH